MVDMLNSVYEGLDKPNQYAYLAAIDFTKAFDLVNHNIIIKKLINLGVRRSIIPIVCGFLSNRTQNTKLANHTSSVKTIDCGVPQGTKLGPLLFLVLVNDAAIGSHRRWKYVDDLTLGDIVKYGENAQLQSHLDDLSEWSKANDVLPKPAKCQVMKISFLRRVTPNPMFTLNDIPKQG